MPLPLILMFSAISNRKLIELRAARALGLPRLLDAMSDVNVFARGESFVPEISSYQGKFSPSFACSDAIINYILLYVLVKYYL